ncbi:hypothetical protein ACOJBM_33620 [Rhizobium beringeri]
MVDCGSQPAKQIAAQRYWALHGNVYTAIALFVSFMIVCRFGLSITLTFCRHRYCSNMGSIRVDQNSSQSDFSAAAADPRWTDAAGEVRTTFKAVGAAAW